MEYENAGVEVSTLALVRSQLTGSAVRGQQTDMHQLVTVMNRFAVYTVAEFRIQSAQLDR